MDEHPTTAADVAQGRLVVRGWFSRVATDRIADCADVSVQLRPQFGRGDWQRREVLRGLFETLGYQRSQRGKLGLGVLVKCRILCAFSGA